MSDRMKFSSPIWQSADLLRGSCRPLHHKHVPSPRAELRRFDCVLTSTKTAVLNDHRLHNQNDTGDTLRALENKVVVAGQSDNSAAGAVGEVTHAH